MLTQYAACHLLSGSEAEVSCSTRNIATWRGNASVQRGTSRLAPSRLLTMGSDVRTTPDRAPAVPPAFRRLTNASRPWRVSIFQAPAGQSGVTVVPEWVLQLSLPDRLSFCFSPFRRSIASAIPDSSRLTFGSLLLTSESPHNPYAPSQREFLSTGV
jgi:hypothetical protein